MLQVKNVSKKVMGKTLLNSASFALNKGDICGLLGPNGAGKTTLIRIITGLVHPTEGEVLINHISVQKNRKQALQHLGAIVETPIFFPDLTARELLINLGRLHPNLGKKERLERINELLDLVGLTKWADDKIKTFSLGMKQRLGIAQTLLGKPSLIVLDEPANGLDPMGMRFLRELILRLRDEQQITFLISSHLLGEMEQICNRLIFLREGEIVWQGEQSEFAKQNKQTLEDVYMELMTK